MKPSLFSGLPSAALTGLFSYTAFSKLLDFGRFRAVLSASPLIAKGAGALAVAVIATELVVCLLLIFPRTRLTGLLGSFLLLVGFTSYLGVVLLYTPHLPCSCGGVIEALSWKGHILLNGAFLALTTWALYRHTRSPNPASEPFSDP